MKFRTASLITFCALVSVGADFTQANLVIYPKNGQSSAQQSKDKSSCAQWAEQQTGVNPEKLLREQQAQPAAPKPNAGAGRGAAAGAAGGAIAGNPGAGAAIGAGVGGARRRRQEHEISKQEQASKSQVDQQLAAYDNAQKTCLEGKGYSVG